MNPVRKIAILDTTGNFKYERLIQIADAIQIQLNRDVQPVWFVGATVKAFKTDIEIPTDFWVCNIVTDISEGTNLNGIHWYTGDGENRRPYSKAKYKVLSASLQWFEADLTKVISEEIIEKCIDPFGELKIKGVNPDPNSQDGQDVEFLVELGDPVQALQNGYYINDVFVTNFIFQSYFYLTKQEGVKYDFLGQFTEPKQLGEGGYQIYQRAGEWYQAWKINGIKYFVKQGVPITPSVSNAPKDNTLTIIFSILGLLLVSVFFIPKLFKKS